MRSKKPLISKIGGVCQFVIEKSEDLFLLKDINDSLWITTSAPCECFSCDPAFLNYLDYDQNKRIRSEEVKDALTWLQQILADKAPINEKSDTIQLSAINTSIVKGDLLHSAAKRVLENLNSDNQNCISLVQVQNRKKILSRGTCNGDGIIPPESVSDDMSEFIHDVMHVSGSRADASGKEGISREELDFFLNEAHKYVQWCESSAADEVNVFGSETPDLFNCLSVIEEKMDGFFALCNLYKIDPRSRELILPADDILKTLDVQDNDQINQYLKAAPLQIPNNESVFYFDKLINPLWECSVLLFRNKVLPKVSLKIVNENQLTEQQWQQTKTVFKEYRRWIGRKPVSSISDIDLNKLKRYVQSELPEIISSLIDDDLKVSSELEQVNNLEKLLLYTKWIIDFLNNYISLSAVYNPEKQSMVQAGKLVLDGRIFTMCIKIDHIEQHKRIAELSNLCIIYLMVTRKGKDQENSMYIAAAVTYGSMNRLYTGKNGVFFTPDGLEWDAQIVDMIRNPVSLIEAFQMPFLKIGNMIENQFEKVKESRTRSMERSIESGFSQADASISAPVKQDTQSKVWGGTMRDVMLGGSLAIAALGSAFAFITNTLKNVSLLNVLSVLTGLLLIVSLPSTIVAYLKMKKRNLATFFEASSWAVNAPLRISWKTGKLFTQKPAFSEYANMLKNDLLLNEINKSDSKTKRLFLWIIVIMSVLAIGVSWGFLFGKYININEVLFKFFQQ